MTLSKLIICSLFLLILSAPFNSLIASVGTISGNRSSFRACYLCSRDSSVNYAILYKGLTVEVIGGSESTRWQVRVDPRASKFVQADGWSGAVDSKFSGWVSPKYLVLQQPAAPASNTGNDTQTDVTSDTATVTPPNSGSQSGSSNMVYSSEGIDLLNTSAGGGGLVSDGSGTANQNGNSGQAESGIYYVFCGTGEDEGWFSTLASNRNISGQPNYIWQHVRRDIGETGAQCEGVVVVKVGSPLKVLEILQKGLVPPTAIEPVPSGYKRLSVHEPATLIESSHKILGFTFVSHSGSDGPLIDFHDHKGKQLSSKVFDMDYNFGKENESFMKRLVQNPRVTVAGCNSGNCQFFDGETSSFSHLLTAMYSPKNMVVRGKTASGSPNASNSNFAVFGLNDAGDATRMSPHKLDYKMRINTPTNRYESYRVPYSGQEELNELLAFYKSRDISVKVSSSYISVRSPSWLKGKWMTRETDKDNVLKTAIYAMSERKLEARTSDGFYAMMAKEDPSALAKTKEMMPRLQELMNDSSLQVKIEVNKIQNNGVLDIDAYSLWKHIYFGNLTQEELRENKWSLPLRACQCADHKITARYPAK